MFNQLTGRIGTATANFNAISEDDFGPLGTGKSRGFRQRDWGGFIQDDWKLGNKLTLNLGLRYDWFQVPWEVNSFYVLATNRQLLDTQLNPALPHVPITFGRVGPKYGTQIFANDLNNFGPVVGFSWDPWGNNKTAIRGSYRISYDKVYGRTLDTIEQSTPGLNGAGQLNAGQLASLYPLTNVFGVARTLRLADLTNSPTQAGVNVGNGNINLASALDITKTQKPLSAVPNTRLELQPVGFREIAGFPLFPELVLRDSAGDHAQHDRRSPVRGTQRDQRIRRAAGQPVPRARRHSEWIADPARPVETNQCGGVCQGGTPPARKLNSHGADHDLSVLRFGVQQCDQHEPVHAGCSGQYRAAVAVQALPGGERDL